MKLVREHINEKFTQDSDPVSDLNIGMIRIIEHFLNYESAYSHSVKEYGPIKPQDYLWMCVAENKIEYVKYLLDNGWNVHHDDDRALRCAAYDGNYEMTKFLLDRGANPKVGVYYAKLYDHKAVLKLLQKYIDK